MADQPSIFNSNDPATQPPAAAQPAVTVPPDDSIATLLASVKNERGEAKYKDVVEALNGLKNAQEYIPTLKNDLAAKDQALAAALAQVEELKTVKESLEALTSQRNVPDTTPVHQGYDEKKIADLVAQTLTQREVQAVQKLNLDTVVSSIQQSFGADAEKVFYDKAKEFGMSNQEMNALASKSPKAVLTMFGLKVEPQNRNVAAITGTVSTSAYQPRQDTYVGRSAKSAMIGASTEDLRIESDNAKKMTDEIHAQGLSVSDLSDPKVYNKFFNSRK